MFQGSDGDSGDGLFGASDDEPTPTNAAEPEKTSGGGLFDSDDDATTFSEMNLQKRPSQSPPSKARQGNAAMAGMLANAARDRLRARSASSGGGWSDDDDDADSAAPCSHRLLRRAGST